MAYSFYCPNCGAAHEVDAQMAGKRCACSCGHELVVPHPPSPAPARQPSQQQPPPPGYQQAVPQTPYQQPQYQQPAYPQSPYPDPLYQQPMAPPPYSYYGPPPQTSYARPLSPKQKRDAIIGIVAGSMGIFFALLEGVSYGRNVIVINGFNLVGPIGLLVTFCSLAVLAMSICLLINCIMEVSGKRPPMAWTTQAAAISGIVWIGGDILFQVVFWSLSRRIFGGTVLSSFVGYGIVTTIVTHLILWIFPGTLIGHWLFRSSK